jgi:hypothetical protein
MNEFTLNKVVRMIKEIHEIGFSSIDMDEFKKGNIKELNEKIGLFCIDEEGAFHPRIIEIGNELNRIGGIALMQEAYYEIIKPFKSHGPILKWAWGGIGGWQN